MKNEKVIILPNKEEMRKRLLKVDDNPYLIEQLYPLLIKHAGEGKDTEGIALMMELASYNVDKVVPPTVLMLMRMRFPKIVDALVDDPKIAEDAKAILATS